MENKREKRFEILLLIIAIAQIILLINMGVSNSYLISQTYQTINQNNIDDKNNLVNEIFDLGVNLIINFVSIKQIGIVSAQALHDLGMSCCLETIEGAICQPTISIAPDACNGPLIPTTCERVSDCVLGCCIDEEEGLCSTRSTRKECTDGGGLWRSEENCLVDECVKACCVLGDEAVFTTETNCDKLSLTYGFEKDFRRGLRAEYECLALGATQDEGACMFNNESCSFMTESECLNSRGLFSNGNLCSNPELNTICEAQTSIGCVEGKDEIYWFDSCGNRENIYSSNRASSWNNGEVLSKEDSCGSGSGNIFSPTCGNCNKFLSSICSPSDEAEGREVIDGEFICKDLRCRDEKRNIRENGESWCVYDSFIGDGKDPAGSRHWRRMCIDGEVKAEPCQDYRGGVCVQSDLENNGESFSVSSCSVNEAINCIGYNNDINTMKEQCEENKDCLIKEINVASDFKFSVCAPRYPRGFDLTGETNSATSAQLCKMASQKCTVVEVKDWRGNWRCEKNCNCRSSAFTEQMNDLCVSLGDCGTYINYLGEGTNNIRVSNAPQIDWTRYSSYANPVDGQFAEPKEARTTLGRFLGRSIREPEIDEGINSGIQALGTISGATGSIIGGIMALSDTGLFYHSVHGFFLQTGIGSVPQVGTSGVVSVSQSFGGAATGVGIGFMVGSMIAGWLGLTGDGATAMSIGGAMVGGVVGYIMMTEGATFGGTLLTWGLGAVFFWAGAFVMAWVYITGWGKTRTIEVSFDCLPWQAPTGSDDCSECNNDDLRPCTEYRCTSLGQACKLINENEENPTCEAIPYEPNPPVITPGIIFKVDLLAEEIENIIDIDEDYEFTDIEDDYASLRRVDESCIPEFTRVLFALDTDEFAQCKYSFQNTEDNYEDMIEYPLELTRYTENHTFGIEMPSLQSLEVYNVTGDIREMYGNMNMYVRCQDYHGNFNLNPFVVNFCINTGPDLTATRINKFEPSDNSFIAYNVSEIPLRIYLNEPAECNYDTTPAMEYDLMSNTMTCDTGIFNRSIYGWTCDTTLTGLVNAENNFYIKCKDQPWLPIINDSQRNINQEDIVFTLQGSESPLVIDSILPQGEREAGFEPISVDLIVETSGGAEQGKAICEYGFESYDEMIDQFRETFSDYHKQNFNMMMRGEYNHYVTCEDIAGNLAYADTNFELTIDTSAPVISRIFKEGNYLKIITDEEAECYYDLAKCSFNIDDAKKMTTGLSNVHTAEWTTGKTHYIKCKDIWGSEPDGCTAKILPSYFR